MIGCQEVKNEGKKYTTAASYKGPKLYKKVYVKIIFNKKTYYAKTDKNGIAKFKITKNMVSKLKKGKTIKYTIYYKKDKLQRAVKIA